MTKPTADDRGTQPARCHYCEEPIDDEPTGEPIIEISLIDVGVERVGWFCCWGCVARHAIDRLDAN